MKLRKIISNALVIATTASVLSWQTNNIVSAEGCGLRVWFADSTTKILQDYEYSEAEKSESSFNISMAQNEVEGGQLILNSDNNVFYNISITDLVNGEYKISKENIDIYHEKYIQTSFASDKGADYYASVMNIPQASFPDALLPFHVAKSYRENKIYAGKNQGVWIDVKTGFAEETPAGDYIGKIKVSASNEQIEIPVKVTVWDFSISTETHKRTLFNYYRDYIFEGEGDSSNDMMEKYYEYFLDYRVNLQKLPALGNETSKMVELVKKYSQDERVNTWALPTFNHQEFETTSGQTYPDDVDLRMERQKDLITALAYESVKDGKNYLAKAVNYDVLYDEYTLNGRQHLREGAAKSFEMFRKYCQSVTKMFDNIYGPEYIDSVEGLRDSIEWLPQLSVAEYNSSSYGIVEYTNIWCPTIRGLSNSGVENVKNALYAERTDEYGVVQKNKELWSYTCNWPPYPYPTYHIDDILYSSRLYAWMMYDYGISGDLYYLSASNKMHSASSETEMLNPYTTPVRNPEANGDGYLVYPGSYYGIDGPVGTLRLTSIRDGNEEYEYLYLLDNLYQQMKDYYGIENLSYQNAYRDIADSLYNNCKLHLSTTGKDLLNAREKIASIIESIQSDEHLIVEKDEAIGTDRDVWILMSEDVELESNPYLITKEKVGNGYRYKFKMDVSGTEKVELKINYSINGINKQYIKTIKKASTILSGFDSQDDLLYVNVSNGGSKKIETLDGKDTVKIVVQTKPLQATFKPWFNIKLSGINNITSSELQLGLYLCGTESKKISLIYKLTTYDSAAIEITLNPGWNNINLDMGAYNIKDVSMIAFYMENTFGNHELYLGELKQYEN